MQRQPNTAQSLVSADVVRRWDKAFEAGSDKRFPSLDLVRLEKWFFEGKPGRTLDYGCGSGANMIYLLESGYRVDGADSSSEALLLVERKLGERPDIRLRTALKHIVADAVSLPFDDETFDNIICFSVLSLLGTRVRVDLLLREFQRVLRRGAKMIVDVNGPPSDFAKKGPRVDEETYEYSETPGEPPILSYCPSNEERFQALLEPYFKVEDMGFIAHKYMGRENFEYLACVSKS